MEGEDVGMREHDWGGELKIEIPGWQIAADGKTESIMLAVELDGREGEFRKSLEKPRVVEGDDRGKTGAKFVHWAGSAAAREIVLTEQVRETPTSRIFVLANSLEIIGLQPGVHTREALDEELGGELVERIFSCNYVARWFCEELVRRRNRACDEMRDGVAALSCGGRAGVDVEESRGRCRGLLRRC